MRKPAARSSPSCFPFLPKVGDWNRSARNTGGTFVEKCCHFFDLMRLLTAREPVRVYAWAGQDVNHLDERYGGETPDILDNGYVVVDFEGGARALLDLCMFAEASENEQEIAAVGDAGKIECFLPESTVVIGVREPRRIERHEMRVAPEVLAAGAHHGSTFVEHQRFRRAVLEGRPAEVTAEDGLRAVAMGVPRDAAMDFILGHLKIELGVAFETFPEGRFSDGALLAIEQAKPQIFRDGWLDRIFDLDAVKHSVREICGEVPSG